MSLRASEGDSCLGLADAEVEGKETKGGSEGNFVALKMDRREGGLNERTSSGNWNGFCGQLPMMSPVSFGHHKGGQTNTIGPRAPVPGHFKFLLIGLP